MKNFHDQIFEVIDSNLTNEQFGVSELAKELNISRSTLHRKVKETTGLTISQCICQVRIQKASELLKENSTSISEIAFDCGFHSVSYFTKCFKDFYGISPGQYKKNETGKALKTAKRKDRKYFFKRLNVIILSSLVLFIIFFIFLFNTYLNGSDKKNSGYKSISIYPFTFVGEDPEKHYLAYGIGEAILHHLSKIKDLHVISVNPKEVYLKTTRDIKAIGEKLNIDYLLMGTYQKENDNINLSVRLIKTKDGKQIWSNEYFYHQTNVFKIQSEIAKKVSEELQTAITPFEKQLIEKVPTFNLTAYDFYLRGREEFREHQMNNVKRNALNNAEKYFHKALEYDPKYAQAYAGLALVYKNKNRGREYFSETSLDSMLILADLALHHDRTNEQAYSVKGLYYWYKGNKEKAIREYNKALELNPNLWEAYRGKATLFLVNDPFKSIINFQKAASLVEGSDLKMILKEMTSAYLWAGFPEEAEKYNFEALQLSGDSLLYFTGLGAIESIKGNFREAIKYYDKASRIDSTYFSVIWFYHDLTRQLGYNHMLAGNYSKSLEFFEKWIALLEAKGEISFNGMHRVGYAYWVNGYTKEAEHYFDLQMDYCNKLISSNNWWAQAYFAHYDKAGLCAFRGEKEKAYQELRIFNQINNPPLWMVSLIKNDPMFEKIRKERKFQNIINDIEIKHQKVHDRISSQLMDYEKNHYKYSRIFHN